MTLKCCQFDPLKSSPTLQRCEAGQQTGTHQAGEGGRGGGINEIQEVTLSFYKYFERLNLKGNLTRTNYILPYLRNIHHATERMFSFLGNK